MRWIRAMAVLAALGTGCVVYPHGLRHRHTAYGPAVEIGVGHVHSDYCGHYYHGGYWYYHSGHVHRPGCGHVHRGGIWLVVP